MLLADDHTMFRESLAGLLVSRAGVEVVGQVPNGDELATLARKEKPEVILTELSTPIERAKAGLRELLAISQAPKVIVVTAREDVSLAQEFAALGASAYISKNASVEHLLAAIRATLSDHRNKNIVLSLPRAVLQRAEKDVESEPSERELEVLLFAARGLSNRKIASHLSLSEATVKRHLANLYAKVGVTSRGEAVHKALSEGWISANNLTRGDASAPGRREETEE